MKTISSDDKPSAFKLIKNHEGWRDEPYCGPAGQMLIGYGINLEAQKLPKAVGSLWTKTIIDNLSAKLADYGWYQKLGDTRKAVILDMTYSMGVGNILEFDQMIEAIIEENWVKAAQEMLDSLWATQVGYRAKELAVLMEDPDRW